MIFRGRQPEAAVWRRFRSGLDGFTFRRDGELFEARVVTNAERALDLFHNLASSLPPAVDVAIEDRRRGLAWAGVGAALPDVRDAVGRLKLPLAAYGGVELAVYTPDEQLTLTPALELYAHARTDRWLYILLGRGLVEQERLDGKHLDVSAMPPAPELAAVVDAVVAQLSLEAVDAVPAERA
jgi:hypothetical protein